MPSFGADQLASPPPSPINDPQGAGGDAGQPPAQRPGAMSTLVGAGPGQGGPGGPGGMPGAPNALPQQAMQGVLQVGQGLTEQARQLAQTVPAMAPKLMQAVTLIEQALADFITTTAAGAPTPMGGQATPGAFSAGAAFSR